MNAHPHLKIEKPAVVHGDIGHAQPSETASHRHEILSKVSSVRSGSIGAGASSMRTTTTQRDEIQRLKGELEREKKARQEAEHILR